VEFYKVLGFWVYLNKALLHLLKTCNILPLQCNAVLNGLVALATHI
jgi:hypothetical protein